MVAPGLCGVCVHARVVRSARGSAFWLCRLSRVDRRFPRYPPLPVLQCAGFRPEAPSPEAEGEEVEPGG